MEASEMQEFSNQMKEAGEAGESLTRISLAISILAVLVAMVTVLGHRSHTEAVLAQARASDVWNQYQAKRIRSTLIEGDDKLLRLQPNSNAAAVEEELRKDKAYQEKLSEDSAQLQEKAHGYEEDVERAEHKAIRFDIGEALLQIAVVLCSVTLFTRQRRYFYLGLAIGVAGVVCAVSVVLVR